MRVLLALLCLVVLATCDGDSRRAPRVVLYGDVLFNTREAAVDHCMEKGNHHIATKQQMELDVSEGLIGHAACGWTYHREQPRHMHCDDNGGNCIFTKCGERLKILGGVQNFPVYCRVHEDDENRNLLEYDEGELIEVFRVEGPNGPDTVYSENEAQQVCERDGNKLAYWSHLAAYTARYNIEICKFSWLRYANALYNVNCGGSGKVDWQVYDSRTGADVICIGTIPQQYRDPCAQNSNEGNRSFQALEGVPVFCDDDGSIIIQNRPACIVPTPKSDEEQTTFKQNWFQYKNGFGKIHNGYWIGLATLSKITKMWNFQLVVEVTGADGAVKRSVYDKFSIGSLEAQYPLHVDGFDEVKSNAGDMFNTLQTNNQPSNGQPFSADPRDNDGHDDVDCSDRFKSGWWFNSCHLDNLNGLCEGEEGYSPQLGSMRTWMDVSKGTRGLRTTKMKIRYSGAYTN